MAKRSFFAAFGVDFEVVNSLVISVTSEMEPENGEHFAALEEIKNLKFD